MRDIVNVEVKTSGGVSVDVSAYGKKGDKGDTGPVYARFDDIADLAASDALTDGKYYDVSVGTLGTPETIKYDADSTATPDGALIVDATGMGAGRLVSTRTVYADWAEIDGDARAIASGTELVIPSIAFYEVVASEENLTTAGGLKLKVKPRTDGAISLAAFGPDYTGVVSSASKLQAAINSFGTDRGLVRLGQGHLLLDAMIDFKRVALEGVTTAGGAPGGTRMTFTGTNGLYSSIEDSSAPHHKNFRAFGSTEKTANGQTLIDFTGQNYPRMTAVNLYGAENGMKLAKGTTVECHYGLFVGCDISRCYNDINIETDVFCQSHEWVGGRSWDNVLCATNDGAQDINFTGRIFEGGVFPNHTSTTASTKTFGCRFEGATSSEEALKGEHTSFGDYTSGFQFRRDITFDAGVADRNTKKTRFGAVGADGSVIAAPSNMLRNARLELDVNDNTKIPGWSAAAVAHTRLAGVTGTILKSTATSAFHSYEQFGHDIPAGEYTLGYFIQRDAADVGFFAIFLQLLDSAGAVIDDSGSGGTNFGASNFTSISGSHRGIGVVRRVTLTTDRTNVRFRAAFNSATGKTIYFGKPFMCVGHTGLTPVDVQDNALGRVMFGTAAPTAGTYRVGDRVYNTAPTAGGVEGWVCVTAGSPGTWKTFGAIGA